MGVGRIWMSNLSQTGPSLQAISGGTGQLFLGAFNPEGVITTSPLAFFWDFANKILYIKDTGENTNTGWRELIA